jgi:aminoglycoside phosphotransferase (APT) family kinase protein
MAMERRSVPEAAIDRSQPTRAGEELDRDRLAAYLDAKLGGAQPITIEQFPGGHSNLTYMVRRGERELVLRRPPFGSAVKSAHDMGREYRVLSCLAPHYVKAPRPLLFCTDVEVIGAEFYLMERVRGLILRRELPAVEGLDAGSGRLICEAMVDALVELHALDFRAIGLGDFGKPEGYVQRQVVGWTRRYAHSRTDDIPAIDEIAIWLAANLPASGPACLLHNDFKLDNLVLDPGDLTRIAGILDWEMSTIGDPLMDLGTALCYWVEPGDAAGMQALGICPAALPGLVTRRELADLYSERSSRDLSELVFYYCFGLWKTAVVAQQIYYRYVHGHTRDPRFARLNDAVRILATRAVEAREAGQV